MNKYKNWQLSKHDIQTFFPKKTKYCICIPVINEGGKIKKQLKKMKPFSKIVDIIITDKGSTDGSADPKFLKSQNVRSLITLKQSGRQGTQLRAAFAFALNEGYEGILQIDGNNKDGVNAIPKFIKALDDGFDYTQGSRFIAGGKAINTPLARWIGVRFIAAPALSLAAKYWYADVTNGFRAYSRKYLLDPRVQPFRDVFIGYELNLYLTIRANQLGFKTKEIPVLRRYPKGKVPTKISKIKGNWDFLLTIFKTASGYYHPKSS